MKTQKTAKNKKNDLTKNKKKLFSDEQRIVKIKVDNKEQIISSFSYDDDKLNKDLSEYIIDKTQGVHRNQEVTLHFFTKQPIAQQEIQDSIKQHYTHELIEEKRELRKNSRFTLIMLVLGLLTIGLLVLSYNLFPNFYFDMIIEIASWVFVWEAVDAIFLKRPTLRRHCVQLEKLCSAKIQVTTVQ